MWQKTKNIYHLFIAVLANILHSFPARKLTVVGVTGTDGKTTTTTLIYHILKSQGYRVSLISTVQAIINDKTYDTGFHVTNPPSFPLQQFLRKAVRAMTREKNYLILEVTSHGIDQNRIWGIPIYIGLLTNVSHEHLDYHKTYDSYVKTKARLLVKAKIAIFNREDQSYDMVTWLLKRKKNKKITYGIYTGDISEKTFPFQTTLFGDHNRQNCLAAAAVCKELGVQEEAIREAIATFTCPVGRNEIVYKKEYTVMIDFAHTPNAFKQILSAVRPSVKGRIIHVFGSAGQRDRSKRPLMGKESSQFADIIVLTSEDPRKEDVTVINSEIKQGIEGFERIDMKYNKTLQNGKKYLFEVPDREKAITFAIQLAQKGDFVLTTGKAHESSMNYGHGEIPWSEHAAVKKGLYTSK